MTKNIRNEVDRASLIAKGFVWATIAPRGENKGVVCSAHKTNAAAERAAKGLDRAIVNIADAWMR